MALIVARLVAAGIYDVGAVQEPRALETPRRPRCSPRRAREWLLDAAAQDIVDLRPGGSWIPAAAAQIEDWSGKIVVDTSNPLEADLHQGRPRRWRTSSEVVAGAGREGAQPPRPGDRGHRPHTGGGPAASRSTSATTTRPRTPWRPAAPDGSRGRSTSGPSRTAAPCSSSRGCSSPSSSDTGASPPLRTLDRVAGTLIARDLHKSHGAATILAGVSVTVAPGDVLGVVGPNGAGQVDAAAAARRARPARPRRACG